VIEPVTVNNLEEVLPLIQLYQEFYKVADIDDERDRHFFSNFSEDGNEGCFFLYRNHGGETVE
jgi:hypothetical protein